jgi:protoporphyrinogen oxidase
MKVAVIGAGPAGMTAAYSLAKMGVEVEVFEASGSVGGMSRTITMWNQKFDLGPHRFYSDDHRINALWIEVVGNKYEMVDRLTRIYYNRKFFSYPIKPFDAMIKLGIWRSAICFFSYIFQKFKTKQDITTFEGWVTDRFGKELYSIFFKTYSEKLWGIPCDQLDADFAAQRIKKFDLWEAIRTAFAGNNGKHKTLVDQFAYPHNGTGSVYENMAELVKQKGGKIHMNTPVNRVLTNSGKAYGIELKDGNKFEFEHVVSTMPLTLLTQKLPDVPQSIIDNAGALKFRNTILVFLNVNAENLFPDNWLYIHSNDLSMGRLTNFRNWVPQLYGNEKSTICALEYWCNDEDEMWQWSDDKFVQLAKTELRKTGLIKDAEITAGHVHKIHRCYPVYSKGYKNLLKPIEAYLSQIQNLHLIGRYGAFKYNNQDHSILMGIMVAENIVNGAKNDLWGVNTDYDSYQESSVITATGLQKKHH